MKLSITRGTIMTCTAVTAALLVTACSNANIRPAPQGPRYYTAAHDTVSGKCQRERLVPSRRDGRTTVEDALPQHTTAVKCVTTAVTTTGEKN